MVRSGAALGALLATALLIGVACSSDDDEEIEEVETTVSSMVAAWNSLDAEAFFTFFTDEGLIAFWDADGRPIEEVRAEIEAFMGDPALTSLELKDTEIDGDTATTVAQIKFGRALDADKLTLTQDGDEWLISDFEDVVVEIPDDYETIDGETYEFAFNLDTDALASVDGPFAIAVENIGSQPHELAIAKVPADADIETLFESEDGDFEVIGIAGPLDSGEQSNLVFTEALESGRYLVLCFLPDTADPEGTPHVFQGDAGRVHAAVAGNGPAAVDPGASARLTVEGRGCLGPRSWSAEVIEWEPQPTS